MLNIILLQATNLCNLNCSYCYLYGIKEKGNMPMHVLEEIMNKVCNYELTSKDLTINWHVGEPLAAGLPFYEEAVQVMRQVAEKHNINLKHTLQTNGTLISKRWAEFFKRENFGIGISVDGPAFLNDKYRFNWVGKGSHHKIQKGIENLQNHGIPYAGLCVLTKESLNYPDEIYDYFIENKYGSIALNVEEIESKNKISSLSGDETNRVSEESRALYRKFMSRIYDRWHEDGYQIRIREFSDKIDTIIQKKKNQNYFRNSDRTSLGILSFKKNGDIVAFSPELAGGSGEDPHAFTIDNVFKINGIQDLLAVPKFKEFKNDIKAGIDACAETCDYFDLCGGGLTSNKFFENGSFNSTETLYCQLHHQVLSEVVIEKLSTYQNLDLHVNRFVCNSQNNSKSYNSKAKENVTELQTTA